jgi:hypothetical protein
VHTSSKRTSAAHRSLCAEYEAGCSPESLIAKGLDKIETMLQHLIGANPPGSTTDST